jgi:hypothetical protein
MTLLAGPFPAEAAFLVVPLGGLLWGVLFAALALPFRFIKATRRPWIAVGIPALAVVALAMHTDWDSMPWHRAAPNSYYLLEVLIRGLVVWAIGIFLAIWFYRRRDARRSAPR